MAPLAGPLLQDLAHDEAARTHTYPLSLRTPPLAPLLGQPAPRTLLPILALHLYSYPSPSVVRSHRSCLCSPVVVSPLRAVATSILLSLRSSILLSLVDSMLLPLVSLSCPISSPRRYPHLRIRSGRASLSSPVPLLSSFGLAFASLSALSVSLVLPRPSPLALSARLYPAASALFLLCPILVCRATRLLATFPALSLPRLALLPRSLAQSFLARVPRVPP